MKCQVLFSRKNKKNISLSSDELAQRVVKGKFLVVLSPWEFMNYCNDVL